MSAAQQFAVGLLMAGLASCSRGGTREADHAGRREPPQVLEFVAQGIPLRAVVTHEGNSDYKAVFYRRAEAGLVHFGADVELLGFSRPVFVSGASPVIRVRHVESGEWFYFKVTTDGVELLPEHGDWQTLRPGVAKRPAGSPQAVR